LTKLNLDNPRILFYGTPDFAVPSLKALVASGYNVVGVVTAPDRKSGRGMALNLSAVKKAALELDIPVFQPTNLKSEEFHQELSSLSPDIQIVIAFRMLPFVVWDFPKMGTFNLHASLLPNYRGAAPINHAIINGEKETGITTFFLKHEIDTGNILMQKTVPIEDEDNAGSLHDKLMNEGSKLVVDTLEGVLDGSITPSEQGIPREGTHAPKLSKEFCNVNWSLSSKEVFNFVRGLSPYPAARTEFEGKVLKLYQVKESDVELGSGEFRINENGMWVGCKSGSIEILELQMEGKKRMPIKDFLNGYLSSH
jgi:methionyl-tRNA formyltransferase